MPILDHQANGSVALSLGALALVTVTYLAAVYGVKRWFFAHYRLD
ncbi:MAG: hypothetical protein WBX25_13910 [Rhodomicrobium sp.]